MSLTKIVVLTTRDEPTGCCPYPSSTFPEWLTVGRHDAFTFVVVFDPENIEEENTEEGIYNRLEEMYIDCGGIERVTYNTRTHQGGIVLRNRAAHAPGTIIWLRSLSDYYKLIEH